MTNDENTKTGRKSVKRNLEERLSPDGAWLSFPKVPNLLRYVSTGLYYGRTRINGKGIRRSLCTKTFEDAKLRLHDFLKLEGKKRLVAGAPETFGEALKFYERSLENDPTLSPKTRTYRATCINRLVKSWPGLEEMRLRSIKGRDCEEWGSKLAGEIDAQYFNNVLGTFKYVLKQGGIPNDDQSPLASVKRMGIEQAALVLPEPGQFLAILQRMETSGAGQQQDCADLARFLAFSGCRISEAQAATWQDVDRAKGFLFVHNAKVRRARNWKETRRVPIIPDMAALLDRLAKANPAPGDRICRVGECQKSLTRACKLVGAPRITHHDLRHLFATRCIESGVDIPTVSRWLGHADGGALAMKIYGHLREQHSAEMATKVSFQPVGAAI